MPLGTTDERQRSLGILAPQQHVCPLYVSRQYEGRCFIPRQLTLVRIDANALGRASCPDGPR